MNRKKTYRCCICGKETEGYGNDPWPVRDWGQCCDGCNRTAVIPERKRIQDALLARLHEERSGR